jgi:hypothetical protein
MVPTYFPYCQQIHSHLAGFLIMGGDNHIARHANYITGREFGRFNDTVWAHENLAIDTPTSSGTSFSTEATPSVTSQEPDASSTPPRSSAHTLASHASSTSSQTQYRYKAPKKVPDVGSMDVVSPNFCSQITLWAEVHRNTRSKDIQDSIQKGSLVDRQEFASYLQRFRESRRNCLRPWCWRPDDVDPRVEETLSQRRVLCESCFLNTCGLHARATAEDPTSCRCAPSALS